MNTVFDKLKSAYVNAKGGKNLTAMDAFLIGALSKSITTVITYPLIRLKTMFQASGKTKQVERVLSARLISLQEKSPEKVNSKDKGITDAELKNLAVPNPRLSLKDPTTGRQELIKLTKLQLLLECVEYYYRGLGSSLYKTCLQAALPIKNIKENNKSPELNFCTTFKCKNAIGGHILVDLHGGPYGA